MIVKPAMQQDLPADPRLRAGVEVERQMAFYLHRAFAADVGLFVLNDLRLVDPKQPEHDGRPGVCQIDHLVLHRWGSFIIESKSVTDEVSVRDDGAGGDEWTRRFRGREQGFPSPIQQARRQGEFLRKFLQRQRESLLGKVPTGLKTLTKIVSGSDQRSFRSMPIQVLIAISDSGKIRRVSGWKEPSDPFQVFVSKADLVADKIREEFSQHRSAGNLLGKPNGQYGLWEMKAEEAAAAATFLAGQHSPRTSDSPAQSSRTSPPITRPKSATGLAASGPTMHDTAGTSGPSCKSCSSTNLTAMWGKFGYYWKCDTCGTNTTMPTVCSACGAGGHRGKVVRIRKDGPKYYRTCQQCEIEERIWTE